LLTPGPVPRAEYMRALPVPPTRRLDLEPLAVLQRADLGREVRQLVRPPRRLDGEPARRVQAEEPDPGLSAGGDVGAHVELEEARHARQGQRSAQAKRADPKRGDTEPPEIGRAHV